MAGWIIAILSRHCCYKGDSVFAKIQERIREGDEASASKNMMQKLLKKLRVRCRSSSKRAAEMLEFALALPLILIVVFGMLDVTKMLTMYTEIAYYSSLELSEGVTRNREPDIEAVAKRAEDDFKKGSIFRGVVAKSSGMFHSNIPNQSFQKSSTNGSAMGIVVCVEANVPIESMTPIFPKTITIHKKTCTVNESTYLKNVFSVGNKTQVTPDIK